jgi:hypothetical protein
MACLPPHQRNYCRTAQGDERNVFKFLRRVSGSDLAKARPPVIRYEREQPGELLHIDAKKLARIGRVGHRIHGDRGTRVRGVGWECLQVAIDDCSRDAYAELLRGESAASAVADRARTVPSAGRMRT